MDALPFPALPPSRDPGMTVVRVGVDLGQRQDFSAIVVTEEELRAGLPHYLARSIERLPLGTSYPDVVARIEQIMEKLERRSWPGRGPALFSVELILDATGVGLAVSDMVRERGLSPRTVVFTGSDRVSEQPHGVVSVGKGWMVSRLQVLLQSGRLHLPRTPEAAILVKELMDYEISVNARANLSFNAKSGAHDDLVVACGLSCGIERSAGRATSRSYVGADDDLVRDQRHAGRTGRRRG